jgi:hypothetical protein
MGNNAYPGTPPTVRSGNPEHSEKQGTVVTIVEVSLPLQIDCNNCGQADLAKSYTVTLSGLTGFDFFGLGRTPHSHMDCPNP